MFHIRVAHGLAILERILMTPETRDFFMQPRQGIFRVGMIELGRRLPFIERMASAALLCKLAPVLILMARTAFLRESEKRFLFARV
jgi:hypothetical protein